MRSIRGEVRFGPDGGLFVPLLHHPANSFIDPIIEVPARRLSMTTLITRHFPLHSSVRARRSEARAPLETESPGRAAAAKVARRNSRRGDGVVQLEDRWARSAPRATPRDETVPESGIRRLVGGRPSSNAKRRSRCPRRRSAVGRGPRFPRSPRGSSAAQRPAERSRSEPRRRSSDTGTPPPLPGRLRGADVEPAIDGERIGRHDLSGTAPGDVLGDLRFPAAVGPRRRRSGGRFSGLGRAHSSPSRRVASPPTSSTRTSESRSVRKTRTPWNSSVRSVSDAGWPKRFSRPHDRIATRGRTASRKRARSTCGFRGDRP